MEQWKVYLFRILILSRGHGSDSFRKKVKSSYADGKGFIFIIYFNYDKSQLDNDTKL